MVCTVDSLLTGTAIHPVAVCICKGDDLEVRIGLGNLLEPLVASTARPEWVDVSMSVMDQQSPFAFAHGRLLRIGGGLLLRVQTDAANRCAWR